MQVPTQVVDPDTHHEGIILGEEIVHVETGMYMKDRSVGIHSIIIRVEPGELRIHVNTEPDSRCLGKDGGEETQKDEYRQYSFHILYFCDRLEDQI